MCVGCAGWPTQPTRVEVAALKRHRKTDEDLSWCAGHSITVRSVSCAAHFRYKDAGKVYTNVAVLRK